jgi:protein involved in polysaccharide export with SLBB domain
VNDVLGVGDCLSIADRGGRFNINLTIDSNGDILLPLHTKIHVAGLTLRQADALVVNEYSKVESFSAFEIFVSRCQ